LILISNGSRYGEPLRFGDGSGFIEKYGFANISKFKLWRTVMHVLYLFGRECSIQRRHQKRLKKLLSSVLTPELRKKWEKQPF
jgi:acetyl/propionyl-CoA carboxylase alpha subunit